MLKTLLAEVKQYKKASILTPAFMVGEVVMEILIPMLMAHLIDSGVEKGDVRTICITGGAMAVMAMLSLACGVLSGKYGARASSGFAHNLRQSMFRNIQTFSFSNIDKYSTAGLVTRMTTDVTNVQNAYQMILRMCTRAPVMLLCAMAAAFSISARLSLIFVAAIAFLGVALFFITKILTPYFGRYSANTTTSTPACRRMSAPSASSRPMCARTTRRRNSTPPTTMFTGCLSRLRPCWR